MRESLIKILSSNMIAAGLGFILNMALARTFSTEEFGLIAIVMTLSSMAYSCADFGLSTTQVVIINTNKNIKNKDLNMFFLGWTTLTTIILIPFLTAYAHVVNLSALTVIVVIFIYISLMFNRFTLSKFQAIGDWSRYRSHNILNNASRLFFV